MVSMLAAGGSLDQLGRRHERLWGDIGQGAVWSRFSQVVAAALSAFILALVTIGPYYVVGQASLPTFWRKVFEQAVYRRYADFSKGVIDTGNIVVGWFQTTP